MNRRQCHVNCPRGPVATKMHDSGRGNENFAMISKAAVIALFLCFHFYSFSASASMNMGHRNKLEQQVSPQSVACIESPGAHCIVRKTLTTIAEACEDSESDFSSTSVEEISSEFMANGLPEAEPVMIANEKFDDFEREMFERTNLHDQMFDRYNLPLTENHFLPAYKAALESDLKTLKKIARLNISLEKTDLRTGETPLHAACRRGNRKVFDFICSKIKRNVSPWNREGMNPFFLAAAGGHRDLVLFMLKHSTMFLTSVPDFYGRSPLMAAGLNGHVDVFKILKIIGQDYLKQDNSGKSLLSQLPPSSPIYDMILGYIKRDMKKDRPRTIRRIAADLSVIYKSGAKNQFKSILKRIGTNLFEIINAPQPHAFNILLAILEMKEYRLFEYYRRNCPVVFDINVTNEYDNYSFFETCLQKTSIDAIEYLITNDAPVFLDRSFKAIIEVDRLEVLLILVDKFEVQPPRYIGDVDLISFAGMAQANDCFKYLLKKYWNDDGMHITSTNLFCQTAERICETKNHGAIFNLFNNFSNGLTKCSMKELTSIEEYLEDAEGDFTRPLQVLKVLIFKKMNRLF